MTSAPDGTPVPPPGPHDPKRCAAAWLSIAWPGNPRVRGLFTSRAGGVSMGAYAAQETPDQVGSPAIGGMNLGTHVGDDALAVVVNRERLRVALSGAQQVFLQQVHGVDLADLDALTTQKEPVADAAMTTRPGVAATVLVADCLPVLFAAPGGCGVAAAHAGWRGLASGVLEVTLHALCVRSGCTPDQVQAVLGPAIGPQAFEVGDEVRAAFVHAQPRTASAFRPGLPDKWWADIWQLARIRLQLAGMAPDLIAGGGLCTYGNPQRFYSYRRQRVTGRQAACVWLDAD